MRKTFLLLDIDGVLLKSNGYDLAFLDTVHEVFAKIGQGHIRLTKRVSELFQAENISAEWDMVQICAAALYEFCAERNGIENIPDIYSGKVFPRTGSTEEFFPYLSGKIKLCGKFWTRDIADLYRERESIFPLIAQTEAAKLFLLDTLMPENEIFNRLISRLLGSENFRSFYGVEPLLETDSYLETKDEILISEKYREFLTEQHPEIRSSVMTYRPSRLPDEAGNKKSVYFVNTPEAECAMRFLGWTNGNVRCIGGGDLCYMEEKNHLKRETYCKPHPFHALSALLYAACGDRIAALETVQRFIARDEKGDYSENPGERILPTREPFRAAVFEDSPTGIESLKRMVPLLRKFGYQVEPRLYGIYSMPEKAEQMRLLGAEVFPDVNTALDDLFADEII